MSALYCKHGRQLTICTPCVAEMEELMKTDKEQHQKALRKLQFLNQRKNSQA